MRQKSLGKKSEEKLKQSSYKCDKCNDLGWIIVPQDKIQPIFIKCECLKVTKVKGEWNESGIKIDMCKYTFKSYNVWNESSKKAKDMATTYYMKFDDIKYKRQNSIMFCGQVGSGKTHLAVALAINLLEEKAKVVYMPYRDTIINIKQNILDIEYYSKTIAKYKLCEVLLIDDLFKGKINESDINIMFEILNYRYLNCLPVIISTEFTIKKLLDFDEAIGSRVYEMCKNFIIEFSYNINNNYRLKR